MEPTGQSFQAAAEFAKREQLDSFLAVGGGSVIDTTKVGILDLYMQYTFLFLLSLSRLPTSTALIQTQSS